MALGRRVHEIRMILGNVAALSEPAITEIVPPQLAGSRDCPITGRLNFVPRVSRNTMAKVLVRESPFSVSEND